MDEGAPIPSNEAERLKEVAKFCRAGSDSDEVLIGKPMSPKALEAWIGQRREEALMTFKDYHFAGAGSLYNAPPPRVDYRLYKSSLQDHCPYLAPL